MPDDDNNATPDDYGKGRRDGQEGTYNPTTPDRIFTSPSDEEIEKKDEYDRGYGHGQNDAKKK